MVIIQAPTLFNRNKLSRIDVSTLSWYLQSGRGNTETEFHKLYKEDASQKSCRFQYTIIHECQDERSNYKPVLFLPHRETLSIAKPNPLIPFGKILLNPIKHIAWAKKKRSLMLQQLVRMATTELNVTAVGMYGYHRT